MELMLAESGERRGQRSFWSLFYWPDQMRNNGGQCHKHWPRYFLFTRNNDSIWAGASDPRTASLVSRSSPRQSTSGCFKQHFHTKSEIKDSDKWIKRMAPLFNVFIINSLQINLIKLTIQKLWFWMRGIGLRQTHQAETETETKPGLRLRDSLRLSGCQSDCQDIFRLTHNLQFWPDSWHGTRHLRRWLAVFLTSKHVDRLKPLWT